MAPWQKARRYIARRSSCHHPRRHVWPQVFGFESGRRCCVCQGSASAIAPRIATIFGGHPSMCALVEARAFDCSRLTCHDQSPTRASTAQRLAPLPTAPPLQAMAHSVLFPTPTRAYGIAVDQALLRLRLDSTAAPCGQRSVCRLDVAPSAISADKPNQLSVVLADLVS